MSTSLTAPPCADSSHEDPAGRPLRVAIVGAGASGIVTARMLRAVGCEVTVFESASDVGGVWSASRAYPGIATQDDRSSYAFSDASMPPGAGEHPSGAAVQAYLADYVRRYGLEDRIRLSTRVITARQVDDETWELESDGPAGRSTDRFDWLVVASGVFSTPHVPVWPGRAMFEARGGRVVTPGDLADGALLKGVRTVVVGWGKSACDIATVASARSISVDVIARRLMWKYPKRLGRRGLTFRHVVLTRAGERLIHGPYRSSSGKVLLRRLPERLPRVLIGRAIQRAIDRAVGLTGLGLHPGIDIRTSNSLVTEGFFEAVADGRIRVHRDQSIESMGSDDHGCWVRLTDGRRLAADVVVAATGYEQGIDFLSEEVLRRASTSDGALLLHRRTVAVDVPRLAVVGWAHSYRSPLTSEVAAVWLAGVISGSVALPRQSDQRARAHRFRLTRLESVGGGTAALPGVTMADLDVMLAELGSPLPPSVRLRQVWTPIDPAEYRSALASALQRVAAGATRRRH